MIELKNDWAWIQTSICLISGPTFITPGLTIFSLPKFQILHSTLWPFIAVVIFFQHRNVLFLNYHFIFMWGMWIWTSASRKITAGDESLENKTKNRLSKEVKRMHSVLSLIRSDNFISKLFLSYAVSEIFSLRGEKKIQKGFFQVFLKAFASLWKICVCQGFVLGKAICLGAMHFFIQLYSWILLVTSRKFYHVNH